VMMSFAEEGIPGYLVTIILRLFVGRNKRGPVRTWLINSAGP
jgi:hypothetical protein